VFNLFKDVSKLLFGLVVFALDVELFSLVPDVSKVFFGL
jgi:hypothetical protein